MRSTRPGAALIAALLASAPLAVPATALAEIVRERLVTEAEPGIEIVMRRVHDDAVEQRGDPVILLHGARVPGVVSFDLAVEGGSLAADLARAGLDVFVVDLRGYGMSTRPAAMDEPRRETTPLVRTGTAVRDLAAAADAVLAETGADQVAILGWATGGHWAGAYAAFHPERVSRVVFYNTLYGGTPEHPVIGRGSGLAAEDDPDAFNVARFRNYRFSTAESLFPSWDRAIPVADKAAWRDPAAAEAYADAALASDPTSGERDPPSFRAPSGALADSFLIATGASLWDARLIEADALVIRSGNDFWSRPEDVATLARHLGERREGRAETLTIQEATHHVHLDRPERGRDAFVEAVTAFLIGGEG
ncbi:MAG: alpha/beta fold hydrolase [Paracoccaceae bacterium]